MIEVALDVAHPTASVNEAEPSVVAESREGGPDRLLTYRKTFEYPDS